MEWGRHSLVDATRALLRKAGHVTILECACPRLSCCWKY